MDAGTLGAKGNVQVVLPRLTESYGDSADPPEPATPVCTLKTFPYKIEHTIQWARELFDEHFRVAPEQVRAVLFAFFLFASPLPFLSLSLSLSVCVCVLFRFFFLLTPPLIHPFIIPSNFRDSSCLRPDANDG